MKETSSHAIEVPFVDLRPSQAGLRDGLLHEFAEVIDAATYHHGAQIGAFEAQYTSFVGTKHCVAVGSGIDALRLTLDALGLGRGDEVLVPAATFIASFAAVKQVGATPVPVDIRSDDYTIDVDAAAAAITPRTRALMPVHLYGQMANMSRLRELAESHGLALVEDACQAHGATRDGISAGAGGTAGAFSFYPSKNLGAMGDAGAVVTDDDALARRIRSLREHGERAKYDHEFDGYTSRLDTLQAVVLLRKLPLLEQWNAQRQAAAALYSELLTDVDEIVSPMVAKGSRPAWHLFVVQNSDPARLASFLERRGIGSGRHYPLPPHLSPAFSRLGLRRGSFPVAERLSDRALSLPLFPGITRKQIEAVAAAVRAFVLGDERATGAVRAAHRS